MDLKFYIGILMRRWWLIAICVIVVAVFSFFRAIQEPQRYQAKVRLLYEASSVAQSVLGNSGIVYPVTWNNPVDTQIQLITTRPNVEEVIRRLRLPERYPTKKWQVEDILNMMAAEVDRNTDIIVLSFTAQHPTLASEVANEIGRVFVERNRSYHQETAREARHFIEEQLKRTEQSLNQAENDLRRFRESNKVFAVDALGSATASQLAGIDSSLVDLTVSQQVAAARMMDARRHLEVTDTGLLLRLEKLRLDPLFSNLQTELARQEAELTVKRAQFKDDAPEVQDIQRRVSHIKSALAVRVRSLTGRRTLGGEPMVGSTPSEERFMTELVNAKTEMAILDAKKRALESSRGVYESRFSALPAKDQELTQLLRGRQAAEETYSVFLKRMQEVRITEAISGGTVRIVEEAANAQPLPLGVGKTVGLSALLGLIFGLGVALLVEYLDDRIRRPEEAQSVLELPVLGLLPWVDQRRALRHRLVVLDDPRSPVTESYRALQTYTQKLDAAIQPQCVMITSPGPKEGKSTILANLAITSAQLGRRTLVVDTDLRAPTQHQQFDRSNVRGICDVVYDEVGIREVIQETDVSNLDLLTPGVLPIDPVQILHAERFSKMVAELRRNYDAIFFDSPPINLFTDAAVLGGMMDSVLLVVDVRSTTRASTLTAKELLCKARVPLLGMVIKNTSQQMTRHQERYFERYYLDRLKSLARDS